MSSKDSYLKPAIIEDSTFGSLNCIKADVKGKNYLAINTLNISFGTFDPQIEIKDYKEVLENVKL